MTRIGKKGVEFKSNQSVIIVIYYKGNERMELKKFAPIKYKYKHLVNIANKQRAVLHIDNINGEFFDSVNNGGYVPGIINDTYFIPIISDNSEILYMRKKNIGKWIKNCKIIF